MNTEIFDRLCAFARENEAVRALLLFGSRARSERPADEFSDYDLLFFVDGVDKFAYADEWLDSVCRPRISFIEGTPVGGAERRVFFENALDMDMIFVEARECESALSNDIVSSWLARGCRVLVDKIGAERFIDPKPAKMTAPTQFEFENLAQTFWFHTIWAMKKLLRGEIWSGKRCIDTYLKDLLLTMLEWRRLGADTWHDGRFFDAWAGEDIINALQKSYGGYDVSSLAGALLSTMRLFSAVQHDAANSLKLEAPVSAEAYASEAVDKLSAPIRLRPMSPSLAISKMISMSNGNLRDINHFMKVYAYARAIAEGERVGADTLLRVEIAAVIHDIAVPICRDEFGDISGKRQESVSRPLVEKFLADSGYSAEFIDRIAFIVSHHHTYNAGGLDHQIIIEADYLVNADEGHASRENLTSSLEKVFRTSTGKKFLRRMFLL